MKLFDLRLRGSFFTLGQVVNETDHFKFRELIGYLQDGAIQGKTQTHMIEYYNLDMILSIGYRVKSNKGVIFRKWANKVLKEYTLKGYAVNQKRLEYLEKTIKLIDIANRIDERLESNWRLFKST